MGLRPFVVQDGLVGEDGTYLIEGLHPRLIYNIFIVHDSPGEQPAKTLTVGGVNSFQLDAGEGKIWDHVVSRPITIRGRIRTGATGTPLPEGQVGLRKDGKRLKLISIWADRDGFFEHRLDTGPGEYRIHAEPPVGFPTSDEVSDLIDERFGQTLHLPDYGDVEVDLTIFEPAVFSIRVLDQEGQPVKNIHGNLHVTFPNGQKMQSDAPRVLDDTGRTRFLLYFPATEFWYEISAHRNGPAAETGRYASIPGAALPEETIILPPACDLEAALFDPSGEPCREERFSLRVIYHDGSRKNFSSRTDRQGRVELNGRIRAAAFVLELHSANSRFSWKSPSLDGRARKLDLGKVVLESESE